MIVSSTLFTQAIQQFNRNEPTFFERPKLIGSIYPKLNKEKATKGREFSFDMIRQHNVDEILALILWIFPKSTESIRPAVS
jgi:hypothetical protein